VKVLVTGGGGFIGSHVVERLLKLGHDVVVVLDKADPDKVLHLGDRVKFVKGDIRRPEDCREAVKGIDAIIHLAARIHVDLSIHAPLEFYETNVRGTMNLLEAVRHNSSVKKFVYMSTAEVYGNRSHGLLKETDLCDARSPYAASKYAGERYCLSYYYTYGAPDITIVRGFNTFGPRQRYGSKGAVIATFIMNVLSGNPPVIYGTGEQRRDYVYVKDMARGIVEASLMPGLGGEIINLASGMTISINEIAKAVLMVTESELKPRRIDARPGEVMRSCGDAIKARYLLGWQTETSFIDGLRETVECFRGVY